MAFRYDTQHLPAQTQAIIRKRDESDDLLKRSANETQLVKPKAIFPTSLFMRLGINPSAKINGSKTLQIYEVFCNKTQYVWFSTDSLAYGISEKQRAKFINAIKHGDIVYIYFVVGKKGDGKNEIQYRAEVADIKTDKDGIESPEVEFTPDEWKATSNKIWIKINNLHQYTQLTVADFVVESSGKVLAESIGHSQYHFGYIKRK